MKPEYETKVLEFDVDQVKTKLAELGAEFQGEIKNRRYVHRIAKGRWIRIREQNGKTKITLKQRQGKDIGSTHELELDVDSFEIANQIISSLTTVEPLYQENNSLIYLFEGIEFKIDFWPMVPPVLEIESSSVTEVNRGLKLLDLTDKAVGDISMERVYELNGLDLHKSQRLVFES